MYLPGLSQTNDPAIKRLLNKRNCLCCEVDQLNKELQVLKDVIRSKQKSLRKMNSAIIHKHKHGSHLSVVNSKWIGEHGVEMPCHQPHDQLDSHEKNSSDKKLICLQGGQSQCLNNID